jgi:hypothetical protein
MPVCILLLVAVVVFTSLPKVPAAEHVVINEFELNPPGEDAGNEWVELYNPTTTVAAIGQWIVQTTAGETVTATLPDGVILGAGGHYLVTNPAQWLDNMNESIVLRDRNGQEIDRTPSKSDTDNDDRSWQRYPDGSDNWVYEKSTPSLTDIPECSTPMLTAPLIITGTLLILRQGRI